MVMATKKTLDSYRTKIKYGKEQSLPMAQGMGINAVIKEYHIPAQSWGYYGSLISVQTKKQIMFWRDLGTHLEFKGLIDKANPKKK